MTDVADAHRPGVRWQRQLVTGTAVAVNVSTVPTVVFSARDGEFLLALLTLRGFIVFQPGLTL